jgi:hypothetical protein
MFISFFHELLAAREQIVISRKIDVDSSGGLQVLNSPASKKSDFWNSVCMPLCPFLRNVCTDEQINTRLDGV